MRTAQLALDTTSRTLPARLYASHRLSAQSLSRKWPGAIKFYVRAHCASFFLYTTLGKAYAYVGFPPVFIGEVLLAGAVLAAIRSQKFYQLLTTPIGISLVLFLFWQSIQTAPHFNTYGIMTMRDAMAWVYSLFGVAIAALVIRLPDSTDFVITRYRSFGNWYPICGFVSIFLERFFSSSLPIFPGTDIGIPNVRGGEFCVEIAGIAAFLMAGYFKVPGWWTAPIVLGVILAGSQNRGGLLAFLTSLCVVAFLRRQFIRLGALTISAFVVSSLFLTVQSSIGVETAGSRQFSPVSIVENLMSIGGSEGEQGLQDTKTWRLNWWSKILDYTVYGPYFWTGKGYGINLAVDDGIITISSKDAAPLRSPHNSHLMFLARSGVPGVALWLVLQLSWLLTMLARYRQAGRLRDAKSAAVFAWLVAYWSAFLVDAAFDVALEGPMLAIPFWTIFGLGWGFAVLFDQSVGLRGISSLGPANFHLYRRRAQPVVL